MSMADRDGVIWFDGEYKPWREANIHILTHSLHYGMGVFEGLRAYDTPRGTAIFRLEEHTDRFFRSAHILGMPVSFDKSTLIEAQIQVFKQNGFKSGYIRPFLFYGSEGMGLRADNLKTHVAIAAWEWGTYMGKESLTNGIKVRTSSYTRHHVNSTLCKAKASGHYINSILALHEAVASGCDEAMLLDAQGYVAEGSGENIFIVKNGELLTPMLTSCLEGITRDTIMEFAEDLGVKVVDKLITRDEVYTADEMFMTGTAAEVTPVREVDGRQIGIGRIGPITEKFQSLFFDSAEGRNQKYDKWLTYVD